MFDKDIFKPEDEKELKRLELEVNKKINLTGDVARNCLRMEQFTRYKDAYAEGEKAIIDTMLKITDIFNKSGMTLETYSAKVLVYMTRLQATRALMDTINNDAKKGKSNE